MTKKPKLSIVILNWNTKDLLKNCLDSIPKKEDYEIIVIDNASTDGSREYLKKLKVNPPAGGEKLKVIFNKQNLGFAKANNQGIKNTKGKYTLLLNSDTIVRPGAIKKLVLFLENNPRVVGASPLLLNVNKTRQVEYYLKLPSPFRILLYHNVLLRPLVMKTPLRWLMISRPKEGEPFSVEQLSGAALMAKTAFWKKYPLDEDYPFLFEDVDWCYRIGKEKKGRLAVVPQAEIVHFGGGSWKQWLGEDRLSFYQHHFRSLLLFVKKHQPRKLFAYKIVLGFDFLTNALVNLLLLRFTKAKVQLRLVFELTRF